MTAMEIFALIALPAIVAAAGYLAVFRHKRTLARATRQEQRHEQVAVDQARNSSQ